MPADITIDPAIGQPVLALQGPPDPNQLIYDAVDLRRMVEFGAAPQPGVFAAGDWKVSERAAGPNMQVDVAANVGPVKVPGTSIAVQGTATSGATLDNRTGAPAVPANAVLLADVHVPANDTRLTVEEIVRQDASNG